MSRFPVDGRGVIAIVSRTFGCIGGSRNRLLTGQVEPDPSPATVAREAAAVGVGEKEKAHHGPHA